MSAHRDLDRQIQSFLAEGPMELPDPSYDEVRDRMEHKRQRAFIGSWRTPDVNRYLKIGLAAAAVLVVAVVGFNLLPGSRAPGVEPSATPEASEAPASVQPSADAFLPEGSFAWFSPALQGFDLPFEYGPPITVTIPASGWMNRGPNFSITKGGEVGGLPESGLKWASTTSGILVYKDPCRWEYLASYPPATTADEIVAALAAQPSRDASDPMDVTVGGYPGKMITLHVPDDVVLADCFRGLYASYTLGGADAEGTEPWNWHQGPGQIDTFWIVDVDGAIVIIDAMYRTDTPADRIEEMRAIAESATFLKPPVS